MRRLPPQAPVDPDDSTGDLWGFTLVRRLRPSQGRRSSVYVYLAPGGAVPSFRAPAIRVLPGPSRGKRPGEPYALDLDYGTCLKLYGFRWRAKTLITLDARYELERLLHTPALPFRLDETRSYTANSYSTTVSGGWDSATTGDEEGASAKLEEGFPAYAELDLPGIGRLPYQIAVYKEGTKKRHVPFGVFFIVNGQVHGALPSNFVSKNLKFNYLDDRGPLLVSVDCTTMDARVREDFFMASRDRVRRNEVYLEIEKRLAEELRNHPGLQAINQQRRQKEMERPLDEDASVSAFQQILNADPSLASLLAVGDRLVTTTGPVPRPPFAGRRFPTFFRIAKEPKAGLIKSCPINQTCRIEFETDAANDYFKRLDSPGTITVDPPNLLEHNRLWNGRWETRFRVPWDAQPGDTVRVTVTVSDVEREATGRLFVSTFTLRAAPPVDEAPDPPGRPNPPGGATSNGPRTGVALAIPRVKEVPRAEWGRYEPPFDVHEALRVKHDGEGGYDYLVNVDNAYLLTELDRARDEAKPQIRYRFNYGLVIAALGMIKHSQRLATTRVGDRPDDGYADEDEVDELDRINGACNGLARVVVPLISSLSREVVA